MAWKFFAASGAEKRAPATVTTPMVRVTHSATQSIANNTWQTLIFDTEAFKTDTGMHSTSSNTSRLVCTVAGKYRVWGLIEFAANVTGARQIAVIQNGATFRGIFNANAMAAGTSLVEVSVTLDLAVGDYVELQALQASGGALNVLQNNTYAPHFGMEKVDSAIVTYVGIPGSLVGQELAYAERTSNITVNTIAEGSATTVITAPAFTADGVTSYWVEFYCPSISWGGSTTGGVNLWLDGVDQGRLINLSTVANVADNNPAGMFRRKVTPAAGSRTFSVRAWAGASNLVLNGGTGGAGTDLPMYIRVERAA